MCEVMTIYYVMVGVNGKDLCFSRRVTKGGKPFYEFSTLHSKGYPFRSKENAKKTSEELKKGGYSSWVEINYM